MTGVVTRRSVLATVFFCPAMAAFAEEAKPYVRTEITYGSQSTQQRLDLYVPIQGSGPFPVVIWIHGGGFSSGDKSSMPHADRRPVPTKPNERPYQIQVPDVDALCQLGYAVVSLNYRLSGSGKRTNAMPDAVRDGKSAVRYLRANADTLRLDPARIAVWGNSAGGYIAAMIGVTGDQATMFDGPDNANVSSEVQAVIDWFGAESRLPREIRHTTYLATARKLPPFLIANGDLDTIVPLQESRLLHEELVRRGGSSTLNVVKGAGHEDPLFRKTQMQPAFDFLQRTLNR